jgi:hypothetical protein
VSSTAVAVEHEAWPFLLLKSVFDGAHIPHQLARALLMLMMMDVSQMPRSCCHMYRAHSLNLSPMDSQLHAAAIASPTNRRGQILKSAHA